MQSRPAPRAIRPRSTQRTALFAACALLAACGGPVVEDPQAPAEDPGVDEDAPRPPQAQSAIVGKKAKVVNTGSAGLRLRTGPGTGYAVILVMPDGAVVDVIGGPSAGWYQVTYNGKTGHCHGDFLTPVSSGKGKSNLLPWDPYKAYRVTQGHNGGSHTGSGAWAWDFGLPAGTPIRAAHFGQVRKAKGNSTVGGCSSSYANDANYVVIDQGNGYESLYLHLRSITVSQGQRVERGDLIGYSGQTGWACGAHLHFQIQRSPDNGGSASWYNPSIRDYFYDTGSAWDPPVGSSPSSRNGVLDIDSSPHSPPGGRAGFARRESRNADGDLAPPGPEPDAHDEAAPSAQAAGDDPHGGAADWDLWMRRAAALADQ